MIGLTIKYIFYRKSIIFKREGLTTSCCSLLRSTALLLRFRTSLGNFLGPARPALFDSLEDCVVGPEIYDLEDTEPNSCWVEGRLPVELRGKGVVVWMRPLKLRMGGNTVGGAEVVVATAEALLTTE